jgi:uncharacterized protein (TIGR02453 family)
VFPGFPPEALTFLRNLKRNNNREWFQPRKQIFETQLKEPMLALCDALNGEFAKFGPDYINDPKKALFRIYRDTRFSSDKTPYKTHVAAIFRRRGEKRSSPAFYCSLSLEGVGVAGGLYEPEPEHLPAIRSWLAENHPEFRTAAQRPVKVNGRPEGRGAPAHSKRLRGSASRYTPPGGQSHQDETVVLLHDSRPEAGDFAKGAGGNRETVSDHDAGRGDVEPAAGKVKAGLRAQRRYVWPLNKMQRGARPAARPIWGWVLGCSFPKIQQNRSHDRRPGSRSRKSEISRRLRDRRSIILFTAVPDCGSMKVPLWMFSAKQNPHLMESKITIE